MSTDISVQTTSYQVEKRDWLLSQHGTDPGTTPAIVLYIPAFTPGTHYPNGYIPSGTVLGLMTSGAGAGMYGPYDDAATDGRQVAAGHQFSYTRAVGDNGSPLTRVGNALLVHGFVHPGRLPFQSGSGSLDTAARTDLKLIHYAA